MAAKERAYAYTKQRVLDSRFPGGAMLSEGEVAGALDMSRDAEGFVEADREFHRIILVATGNPVLVGFYDSLRDRQRRMIALSLSRDPHRTRDVIAQHRELALAIAARDGA